METLARPDPASQSTEPELHLLAERDSHADWLGWRRAALGSLGAHLAVIILLLLVKTGPLPAPRPERMFVRHLTPLFIPPDLTQKAPNKEPVKKEVTIAAIAPHPQLRAPAPAPAPKPGQAAKPAPLLPPQPAPVAPKPVQIEPPKIEAATQNLQAVQIPKATPLPPPPGNAAPKIAFEDVSPTRQPAPTGKPSGAVAMPNTSVEAAVRNLTRSGAQAGLSVGDSEEGGSGLGLNLPPSAGRPHSSLELKSDPLGVDFRPYMQQVLAAVRRNWFAVYPEAARLGQRGQVILQFAIAKQGLVTKVIFSGQSGAKALDQSAVAAISASNPLPPLPPEFKGDRIILQMTFSYNMPR